MRTPYCFDEFFASGMEESVSPFLTPNSRHYGKHLDLKSAGSAAFFLSAAFSLSFYHPSLAYIFLSFVYFLAGIPALIAAFNDIKNLEINIDVLMTAAACIAALIGSSFEGALLLVLFSLSHGMEASVAKKTKSALHALNQLAPKIALISSANGVVYEKAVKDITIGERLFIKNGEIIPLDGTIIEGNSSLNLVHLTGESVPVPKTLGDTVPAGARNLESALVIEVTRINSDSTISKIIQLITQAQQAKPQLQRLLDRLGKKYATAIISLTFLFALLFPLIFKMDYFGQDGSIYRALAFLIAASPCALIIATPTAYLSAISSCARKGILLKGGITLDALASCSTIAFDKTGTLTTGELACTLIESLDLSTINPDEALKIAYALERHVTHPIADAICKLAISKNLQPAEIDSIQPIPGFGLKGIYESKPVFIGLPSYLINNLPPEKKEKLSLWIKNSEVSVVAVLAVEETIFIFRFSDQVRKAASLLIEQIKTINQITPIMLTGDNWKNAEAVGRLLKIDQIIADLRPEDKLNKVAELSNLAGLAMVGDGINDAPALARATVGISMGKIGSATAVDASDVILLNDDLHLISWLFSKSKKTIQIVKQNLTLALCIICLTTIPALLGFIPVWIAVLLHEGGTVIVGLNSLRLLK